MRIIIESEEKPIIPVAPTTTEPSQIESINAGAPAASFFQSATVMATALAEAGNFREGIDAGEPPAVLVQALQGAASSTKNSASEDSDAGAAPST
jgi:hypothetical protein